MPRGIKYGGDPAAKAQGTINNVRRSMSSSLCLIVTYAIAFCGLLVVLRLEAYLSCVHFIIALCYVENVRLFYIDGLKLVPVESMAFGESEIKLGGT